MQPFSTDNDQEQQQCFITATEALNNKTQDGDEKQRVCSDEKTVSLAYDIVKSTGCQWAEEINVAWNDLLKRSNLLELRDFLQQGMNLSVVEEKVTTFIVAQQLVGIILVG